MQQTSPPQKPFINGSLYRAHLRRAVQDWPTVRGVSRLEERKIIRIKHDGLTLSVC